jgi:hypothetical protein
LVTRVTLTGDLSPAKMPASGVSWSENMTHYRFSYITVSSPADHWQWMLCRKTAALKRIPAIFALSPCKLCFVLSRQWQRPKVNVDYQIRAGSPSRNAY